MNGDYEIHITIEGGDEVVEPLRAYADEWHLHTSRIRGWDELGDGDRHYLTWHDPHPRWEAKLLLMGHTHRLQALGFDVVRVKIETCVFDLRFEKSLDTTSPTG